jgi:hypothetical protein
LSSCCSNTLRLTVDNFLSFSGIILLIHGVHQISILTLIRVTVPMLSHIVCNYYILTLKLIRISLLNQTHFPSDRVWSFRNSLPPDGPSDGGQWQSAHSRLLRSTRLECKASENYYNTRSLRGLTLTSLAFDPVGYICFPQRRISRLGGERAGCESHGLEWHAVHGKGSFLRAYAKENNDLVYGERNTIIEIT